LSELLKFIVAWNVAEAKQAMAADVFRTLKKHHPGP
jgi:hypothetical protein